MAADEESHIEMTLGRSDAPVLVRQRLPSMLLSLGITAALLFWLLETIFHTHVLHEGPFLEQLLPTDVNEFWMRSFTCVLFIVMGLIGRTAARRFLRLFARGEQMHQELQEALTKVIRGMLPICMHCKGIRDESGRWHRIESYVAGRTEAVFSHGICPLCLEKHHPEPAPVQ